MKSLEIIICILFYVVCKDLSAQQHYYYYNNKKIPLTLSDKEITIKFKPGYSPSILKSIPTIREFTDNYFQTKQVTYKDFYNLSVKKNADIIKLIDLIRSQPEIEFCNPVFLYKGETPVRVYDRFIVQFSPSISRDEIETLNKSHNVKIVQESSASKNLFTLKMTDTSDLQILEMANLYSENPNVIYSEPDFISTVHLWTNPPNDTYFSNQYYLYNTGQTGGVSGADINILPAWGLTTGSSSITVAVIDDGGQPHVDIPSSRIVSGYDYMSFDNDPSPEGNEAHGMACSGIIGATQNNNSGISGIAPDCKLMFLRISDKYARFTTFNYIANAIDFAWQHGADVLSNSWGMDIPSDNIQAAINRALTQGRNGKGSVVVFAAGNNANRGSGNYGSVSFPAYLPGVIAVGATDKSNNIQFYSPRGSSILVVAPSGDVGYQIGNSTINIRGDVWSTDIPGQPGWNPGNYGISSPTYYYEYTSVAPSGDANPPGDYTAHFGGTSAACPQVAGVAALMLSVNPNLTASQVNDIIKNSATDMGTTGFDTDFGYGRVNATQSILFAMAYGNKSDSYSATSDNHNRVLSKGYLLYETFTSGGEIFMRGSTDNGTSWNFTKKMSTGIGNNANPSLVVYKSVGTTDTINVVWQRKVGTNTYDVYYSVSGNSGTSWSTPYKIASNVQMSADQPSGPQPVIAGVSYSSNPNLNLRIPQTLLPTYNIRRILVVYTSSSGLKFTYCDLPNYTSWSSPSSISTSAYGGNIWYPSLSSLGGNSGTGYLSYDARYYHKIYSQIYDAASNTWSSEAVIYDGTAQSSFDRQSCIAAYGNTYAAWQSYDAASGKYVIRFRQGQLVSNTWSTWQWSYTNGTDHLFYPSITAYSSTSGEKVAITEYSDPGNQIFLHEATTSGRIWQTYSVGSNSKFANLPHINAESGNTGPIEIWTNNITSNNIYPLEISTQFLPKESPITVFNIYKRALVSNNLRIEIDSIYAFNNQGEKYLIAFRNFDYTKQADLSNPWIYLELGDSTTYNGIDKVQFNFTVAAPGTGVDTMNVIGKPNLDILPEKMEIYSDNDLISEKYIRSSGPIVIGRIELPLQNKILKNIKPVFKFSNKLTQNIPVKFTTIENFIPWSSIQGQKILSLSSVKGCFNLSPNYPNPFNPSTNIEYQIPNSERVTLKVYDILGKNVATLVDEIKPAGKYTAVFDGRGFPSGLYIYIAIHN